MIDYQLRVIYLHQPGSQDEEIDSRVVGNYNVLETAVREGEEMRSRLRNELDEGVDAVLEVVDWKADNVLWRRNVRA